jgi:probable rRNA maturation factor
MVKLNIDLIKKDNRFKIKKNELKNLFFLVLDFLKISGNNIIEFSITFTDDLREINKKYRKIDKSTNVLTFSLYDKQENIIKDLAKPCILLGDIFFSYNVLEKEAKEQNKTFDAHFAHLLVHAYLHLLTFDHKTKDERDEMEKIEISILKKLKIKNPYIFLVC